MSSHKKNNILITACIVLLGCTSPDKKGTKKTSNDTVRTDVGVSVNVNNKKNDEYSAALVDFYKEKKINAAVGDSSAETFVMGYLSEKDNTVTLVLKIFKGNNKKLCSNYIYEAIVNGDTPEKIIEQGFKSLLKDIKEKDRTPLCLHSKLKENDHFKSLK